MTDKRFYILLAAIVMSSAFIFGCLIHLNNRLNDLSSELDLNSAGVNAIVEYHYKDDF